MGMERNKIKIEIEFTYDGYARDVDVIFTKNGEEITGGGQITVGELIAMYSAVSVVKEGINDNAVKYGMDFDKAMAKAKSDKRGPLDRMVDWVNGR